MQKEKLISLKRIYATPKMVNMAINNKSEKPLKYKSYSSIYEKNTKYDMFIRCQTRGKVLMISIFFPDNLSTGCKKPIYEIYCNPEGNEFLTRIVSPGQHEKWSTAKFENLGRVFSDSWIGNWYLGREQIGSRIWQNNEGKNTIKNFLNTKDKGWMGLIEWQDKARKEQIKRKEEKQKKPWDEDMKLVPDILPGFKRWAIHEATDENYIFYKYSKSVAKEGYCSYCEKKVPIIHPLHNTKTKCPCCKKQVIFKADGRIQTLARDTYFVECIQKIRGGIVIRNFSVRSWYRGTTPDKPHITMNETKRYLAFDNKTNKSYQYAMYKNKYMRWIPGDDEYYARGYGWSGKLYTRNFANLKKGPLKTSAIDMWKTLPVSADRYLYVEKGNPAIEMLAKIKMFHLATDLIEERYDTNLLNENETELAKMLKLDKARLKRLKEIDGSIGALRWMQAEKRLNIIWPDKMIKDFGEANFIPLSEFGFLKPPLHMIKIWNYLKRQAELSGDDMYQVKCTWSDYINMAVKAKWNVNSEQIIKPKNLEAAHGEVILYLQKGELEKQAKALEKKWPEVNRILPEIKKFEYTSGEYQIVTPTSILDIVKEGTALRHCVHTCDFYFDRIQKRESYLFFLRKSSTPDTPWYTLEVEPSGNIRQKRTTGDNQNEDFKRAIKFLKEWQKVFRSRLTKEEKELGILADKVRVKEYENLRKNGNKVWHGKLAGQLLADVLEKDFMEAAVG